MMRRARPLTAASCITRSCLRHGESHNGAQVPHSEGPEHPSTGIPACSFTLRKGKFTFEGVINGVTLEAVIRPLILGNDHEFKVEGQGANLTGTVNPVMVGLTIGDDSGSTTVKAERE